MTNPRETAWRVFATELNSAAYEIKAEEEKKPSYVVSRLGAYINRVLLAGVLTEKENVGSDDEPMWRGRVLDSTAGTFFINVGKFQPEASAAMSTLEVPCRVAIVGKVRTYNADDGKVWISVRPERIVQIDENTQNEWLLDTAKSTWKRLIDMKKAINQADRSPEGLMAAGLGEISAKGVSIAIEQYGMPESALYLKTIQSALRILLPEKNVDLGIPGDLADAPEEIDLEPEASEGDSEDKENIVLQLLKELDTEGKGAARDELEDAAAEKGISPMELEEITGALLDKGQIYEPNLRYLRLI